MTILDMTESLSRPAFLACVSYIILAFALLIPMGLMEEKEHRPKYNFTNRVLLVIIMIIPICLSIYSINCMVVGGCNAWAWIQSIAVAIWVALFIIMTLIPREENYNINQCKQ